MEKRNLFASTSGICCGTIGVLQDRCAITVILMAMSLITFVHHLEEMFLKQKKGVRPEMSGADECQKAVRCLISYFSLFCRFVMGVFLSNDRRMI